MPFAELVFNYRSRSALQALHIIPRSPSPVPIEERDINELSMDELRELELKRRVKNYTALGVSCTKLTTNQVLVVKKEIKREYYSIESDGEDDLEVMQVQKKKPRTGAGLIDLCD
ncbi:hypothetical protein LTR62_007315 [Meristemomyces frigidus]|uniref:Uncharacterized protein n=1 Tax=Meristemomyces frigidus TaxID=1508187 RepID=A0AAN7TH17_9PEZI|nr:hypothetical protein LTR62_007315 [Meristemomyces frigidus]